MAAVPLLVLLSWAALAQEVSPTPVLVTLSDGQSLRATVDPAALQAWHAGAPLEVRVGEGLGFLLPAGLATAVDVVPEATAEPHRYDTGTSSATRHFFTPTAMPLEKGTGYVSQMEVLATVVDYGITDWLTLEAGTSIPLALFSLTLDSDEAANALIGLVGAKAAVQVAGQVHIAAGGFGLGSPEFQLGLPYAEMTLGDQDRNVTFGAGAVVSTELDGMLVPVVVGGIWRVKPKLGLVTENWLVFEDGDFLLAVDAAGVRFLPERGRWSVDLALMGIVLEDEGFLFSPIPWLDVSWHF
jgi:hypothetical protein